MNKRFATIIIIIFQLGFLTSMAFFNNAQLTGATKITLKTIPVDPVSIFRGNYANLRYEINSLPVSLLKDASPKELKKQNDLFVLLKKKKEYWEAEAIYKKMPANVKGVFLRGRLRYFYPEYSLNREQPLQLEYGIESFFLNEKNASEVDRANRGGVDWQTRQREREKRLSALEKEVQRINKSAIDEYWLKRLDTEMNIWINEGIIMQATRDVVYNKYQNALEKIKQVNAEIDTGPERKNVIVEVAIDRNGYGHPLRLFIGDKEYK